MPEARIVLSETAIYLATSPKSNSAYMAINNAMDFVNKSGSLSVPLHIRNAPTQLMKNLGYGTKYKYPHSYEGNFAEQEFLPDEVSGTTFYVPGENKHEQDLRNRLRNWWGDKYKLSEGES